MFVATTTAPPPARFRAPWAMRSAAEARLVVAQILGVFAVAYMTFAVAIPGVWHDQGFPAFLRAIDVGQVNHDSFKRIIAREGTISGFAFNASALVTLVVLVGVDLTLRIRHFIHSRTSNAFTCLSVHAAIVAAMCTLFFVSSRAFFEFSFTQTSWKFGFEYAHDFFQTSALGAEHFGWSAAVVMTAALAIAAGAGLGNANFVGLYPQVANRSIPRVTAVFAVSWVAFRWVLQPAVIRAVARKLGMLTTDGTTGQPVSFDLDQFATLASISHTLALALGVAACDVIQKCLHSLPSVHQAREALCMVNAVSKLAVFAVLGSVFFRGMSVWFQFAATNNMEFVSKFHNSTFDHPASEYASQMVGTSYTLWFLLGALMNEVESISARCATIGDRVGIRRVDTKAAALARIHARRAAAKAKSNNNNNKSNDVTKQTDEAASVAAAAAAHRRQVRAAELECLEHSLLAPLMMCCVAAALLLAAADPLLLGQSIASAQSTFVWMTELLPRFYGYLFDNYTQNEIFFMTLPVLLISELPIYFFTVLDLLKLKSVDKYRIHYSTVEHKRPRVYPSNAELWKCWKVHCRNFFGGYCVVFVLGVGAACALKIYPYSFTRDIPSYWFIEFLIISFMSDCLFYWFHRLMHMKRFYASMHKVHHEWVYTIALAHHYMDIVEALIFMLPPIIPPMLFGTHIAVMWVYMFWVQLNAIMGHSAFCIPVLQQGFKYLPFLRPDYHDLHHLRFNVNYGATYTFTDKLFGTYRYEPIVYLDGVDPVLEASTNAFAQVDPFEADEIKADRESYAVVAEGAAAAASTDVPANASTSAS